MNSERKNTCDEVVATPVLRKREYFAAMTLQSVISNPAIVFHGGKQDSMFTDEVTMSGLVSYSIKYADELIKQLEDGRP